MASVTFSPSVGGNGSTVTDDADPATGLDGGGHRTRFVPALSQIVAVANWVLGRAAVVDAAEAVTAAANTIVVAGLLMIPDRQTGAAFTVGPANYSGVVERASAAANITTLAADAPVGANVVIAQMGAGQTTLTAGSGATLINASGLFKTRALYSEASARVTTNVGGAAAVWIISGDLA